MNIEIKSPAAETPDLCIDELHSVAVLSGIYLDFGLPLDLAARAAIADYELFDEEILSTS